ncbi:MAG: hypothetical protein ACR2NL_10200 [Acidimicrobiia bacterium]
MPRRVAKASRSQQMPASNTVNVVSGSIRPRDDDTALAVKLSIWDTEVTMRANGVELGNWPTDAVTIRALDATSFEFVAEGDELIFTPDDPEEFGRLPQVSTPMLGSGRKRSKRSKESKKQPKPAELAWHEDSAEEKRRKGMRPKRESTPKAQKKSRRERKAEAAAASLPVEEVVDPVVVPDARPVIEPAQTEVIPQQIHVADPVADSPPERRRETRAENGSVEPNHSGDGGLKGKRHQAWIFALDQARKYDLMGLDRVPVNESQRGKDHEHTWNHRVAPQSGLGSRICTVCGEIRRSH